MTQEVDRIATEIAHVLFMDLVQYSLQPIEEQARLTAELQATVQSTREYQRAAEKGNLVSLNTGDGLALVFFGDPTSPVYCAVEVAQALKKKPHLRLRMGINSGPVSRTVDITGKANVNGGGINIAQRVMDCGDDGHILLSQRYAEDLQQYAVWANSLQDIGMCSVKHDRPLHLFSLVTERAGNPVLPMKLQLRGAAIPPDRAVVTAAVEARTHFAPAHTPGIPERQVALLYKRNAPNMQYLTDMLERELSARGFPIFIDRHMAPGVSWAQELQHQVRSSYAVIPLLSAESIWSEMLEQEIQTAHEAAQVQAGKPRLLPVRVGYEGPLPDALAHRLDAIQYTLWRSKEDDEALVNHLVHALQSQPNAAKSTIKEKLEAIGGAVPLDSKFYIVRPTDDDFAESIRRRDSIVLVKGARQMGKTSLLARGLKLARDNGAKCVRTDFQKLNTAQLESVDTLYLALAEIMVDQLDLDVVPEDVWNPRRGANVNFERFLRREVLSKFDSPVVWAMDEVDRLFTCSFGSEVFGLFRSWHNERSLDPEGPWAQLTLAIAYATEAHLFITDMNQSPFNVGTRLLLDDFTQAQVSELNGRYGGPLTTLDEVKRFHALLAGQPYLTRKGLDQMVARDLSYETLEAQADQEDGVFGDHLRRLLISLTQDDALAHVVRDLLNGQPCPSAASFYRLRSAGILTGASEHECTFRCSLYARYLERHLQ